MGNQIAWKLTLSHGNVKHQIVATNIIWPLNTDKFVIVEFDTSIVTTEFLRQLDEWEASGAEISVSATAYCTMEPYGPCPSKDFLSYNSFTGKAVIKDPRCESCGWVYNPIGFSQIPLYFKEIY